MSMKPAMTAGPMIGVPASVMRSTVSIPFASSSSRIMWPIIADSVDSFDQTTTPARAGATAASASSTARLSDRSRLRTCPPCARGTRRRTWSHVVGCRAARQARSPPPQAAAGGRAPERGLAVPCAVRRPGPAVRAGHRSIAVMKASARAVVIGGGGGGASVLYHLAKMGWADSLLIEKSELTSGSTWHAAGGMHTFNGEANISRLQKYTIDLYREIETRSGQSCGLHPNGGLMLAATQGELDSLKLICSRARYLGMETEMITLAEAAKLNPLIDRSHFIGALWRADGG